MAQGVIELRGHGVGILGGHYGHAAFDVIPRGVLLHVSSKWSPQQLHHVDVLRSHDYPNRCME